MRSSLSILVRHYVSQGIIG